MPKKRAKRKPASQEKIYDSIVADEKITTAQKINEILTSNRAQFLGIELNDKFYEHPELKDFYQDQWAEGRIVIDILNMNKWCSNPQYGNKPLRIKKINELMKSYNPDTISINRKENTNTQQITNRTTEKFVESKYIRNF